MTIDHILTKLAILEYKLRYFVYENRAKRFFHRWMFNLDQESGQKYGALKLKMVILKKVIEKLESESNNRYSS